MLIQCVAVALTMSALLGVSITYTNRNVRPSHISGAAAHHKLDDAEALVAWIGMQPGARQESTVSEASYGGIEALARLQRRFAAPEDCAGTKEWNSRQLLIYDPVSQSELSADSGCQPSAAVKRWPGAHRNAVASGHTMAE